MNVKILHAEKNKTNLFFSDYFQRQDRSIVLLTHYREESSSHEKINSIILQSLVKIDFQNILWEELPALLKEFFLNLNWELFAHFRNFQEQEVGVSIFLAIIEDNNICFVSGGRFLAGVITQSGLDELGKNWDHFHVKTKENLGLLGVLGKDIEVKPVVQELPINSIFVTLPADKAKTLNLKETGFYELADKVSNEYKREPFPYWMISFEERKRDIRKPWYKAKKFRIPVVLMLLMLIFSIYYLFMGRDVVDDRLHITREQFQLTLRNIDILKLQEILPLDYGILLVPQHNIELTVDWESTLSYPITLKPYFCLRNIYLVSNDVLYAYDKRTKRNTWKTNLNHNVVSIEILDSNLMLVMTADNISYCLKRDNGDLVWTKGDDSQLPIYSPAPPYQPVQISLEMDRRLNNSIILIPYYNSLTLINILNGDTLTHYSSDETINYVSDFDFIERSVYMVKGNKLYKVRIEIRY
ncbi:MAG: PQQ-like beta-propeller repeat protein [Candidatus Cloacimonetes bacterium]|nr:PQQ-like beta-propeller repeat protein [Candidatus Cloacimonadota bacterium]